MRATTRITTAEHRGGERVELLFEVRGTNPHQFREAVAIQCVSPDDGGIVIPVEMIDDYNDAGRLARVAQRRGQASPPC